MAVLTAQGISSVAIELLLRAITLPRTVTRIPGGEFRGDNGDTITVRVPQPRVAKKQSSPGTVLVANTADEIPVDISLAHLYDLHDLTDEEANFDLENFARQIAFPQVAAVARGAEAELAEAMNDLDVSSDIEFAESASADDTLAVILAAREYLGESEAPPENRWAAVSTTIATRILSVPAFTRVNESGSDQALRNAIIGRLYGFTFVESNALDADTAIFYHQSGFAFATLTPVAPRGATESATASEGGVGIRTLFQYDASHAKDQHLVSTFAGAAAVVDSESSPPDSPRFVKVGVGSS